MHNKPYTEAAEKFGLDLNTVLGAVTATRIEMVLVGGTAGELLHGEDEHPQPLDQGAHLDPTIVAFFAGKLSVSPDKAREVMAFLIDEWNEYDEEAEATNDTGYDALVSHLATRLKISKLRAAWYVMLMISRPAGGPAPAGGIGIEAAIVAALGVSQADFDRALG